MTSHPNRRPTITHADRRCADTYITVEWANDGGAVAETARTGRVADADMDTLRAQYGSRAPSVAAALVAVCRERADESPSRADLREAEGDIRYHEDREDGV